MQQSRILSVFSSQVGRKLLTGITGISLVLFVIVHLAGNLQLLSADPEPFNAYGKFLHDFGSLLILAEIGLGAIFLIHAAIGISIWWRKRKARGSSYGKYKSKGGPSKQSVSSRTMIITGSVLLVFLVIHLIQFRFGADPGTTIDGEQARDLYFLVEQVFSNIAWVIFYSGVMILLGFHLRHGVWSALQSLGAMKPSLSKVIYSVAAIAGVLLSVGFLILPILIYLRLQ